MYVKDDTLLFSPLRIVIFIANAFVYIKCCDLIDTAIMVAVSSGGSTNTLHYFNQIYC